MDPFSGVLKVAGALQSGKEYKLTARATDNGLYISDSLAIVMKSISYSGKAYYI